MKPEIRVHRHIDEIDPALWDEPLDADDLQATHRFVSACQHAALEDAEYRHLVILEGGRVAGTASLFRMHVSLELLAGRGVRHGVQAMRRLAADFCRWPVLFGGLPVSFGGSCLRVAATGDPRLVAAAVSEALSAFARETGTRFQCIKELDPAEEERFAPPLAEHGFFAAPSLPSCWLPVRWTSWNAYLAAMRAPFRRQLVASARHLEDAGARIRLVDDYRPQAPAIFRLYRNVMERAPHQLEQLNEQFLVALKTRLGEAARAVLVERDEELLAAAILLESPRQLTFLIAGIDYQRNRETHAYLGLVATMVAEAIRTGKRRLLLGQTSYYLKGRLGALTSPRRIFIRHGHPLAHRMLRGARGMLFPERRLAALRVFRDETMAGPSARRGEPG